MNDTHRIDTRPDVTAFVDQVRARLSDLTEEEREELLGGMEGDLAELVADGGSVGELGDPRSYADELRAAAGLGTGGAAGTGLSARNDARLADLLDGARRHWDAAARRPGMSAVWEFARSLQPVWWLARAWVAVQLLDWADEGQQPTLIPGVIGPGWGVVTLALAVLVSVQVGRGRWWPGRGAARGAATRLVLLTLNVFAVLMLWLVLVRFESYEPMGFGGGPTRVFSSAPGLHYNGAPVLNIHPYDADGKPLEGVQLFDQSGEPLRLSPPAIAGWRRHNAMVVGYPWLGQDGRSRYNVFPLPEREQNFAWHRSRGAWTSAKPPALPMPPLVAVQPVELPSSADDADDADDAGDAAGGPTGDASPSPKAERDRRTENQREKSSPRR